MSNPEGGGVERSAKRHSFAIWGMVFSVLVVGIVILVLAFWSGPGDGSAEGVVRDTVPEAPAPTVAETGGVDVEVAPADADTPLTGEVESQTAN